MASSKAHLEACARYRARHKERVRETQKKYYENNREKVSAYKKEWGRRNPEAIKAINKRSWEKNKHKRAAAHAAYVAKWYLERAEEEKRRIKEWKRANPTKRAAHQRKYYEENAERFAMWGRIRKDRAAHATPPWAIQFFMNEAYSLARLRTKLTGIKWSVDHIVPLMSDRVCGLHAHTNLRLMPAVLNGRKSNLYWPDMPGAAKELGAHGI